MGLVGALFGGGSKPSSTPTTSQTSKQTGSDQKAEQKAAAEAEKTEAKKAKADQGEPADNAPADLSTGSGKQLDDKATIVAAYNSPTLVGRSGVDAQTITLSYDRAPSAAPEVDLEDSDARRAAEASVEQARRESLLSQLADRSYKETVDIVKTTSVDTSSDGASPIQTPDAGSPRQPLNIQL